jgi:hypothetical protein
VRNLPPDLRDEIRRIAQEEGRSVSAQVTVLLREATRLHRLSTGRHAAAGRLQERRLKMTMPSDAPRSEDLVREDREAR